MIKNYIILALLLVTSLSTGQNKESGGSKIVHLNSSGAILGMDNYVNGYYYLYQLETKKKGIASYGLQILDDNLNEVAFKKTSTIKGSYVDESKFNNKAIGFTLLNTRTNTIKLMGYDIFGEPIKGGSIQLSKKEMEWQRAIYGTFDKLLGVPNKGFLYTRYKKNKKTGYILKFFPSDGNKAWEYKSPVDSKEYLVATPILATEDFIVLFEFARPSFLSKKISINTKVLNSNTGKIIKELTANEEIPKMITSAFVDQDNNIKLMGEYFEPNAKVLKSESLGLFVQTITKEGIVVSENFSEWENDIFPKLEEKEKANRNFYFHEYILLKDGSFAAIAEEYKRTLSGGGVALKVLTRGAASATNLTISNAKIFTFDKNFEIQKIQNFEKGKSQVSTISDLLGTRVNALILAQLGSFDYEFTIQNKERNRFYACFLDYERIKGEKNKTAFKTVIYDNGVFSEDKFYLKGKGYYSKIMPGNDGNVSILEYNKDEKTIDIRLEKLNIN